MSTHLRNAGTPLAASTERRAGLTAARGWRTGGLAIAVALAGNLIAFAVASVAGAGMTVQPLGASEAMNIRPGLVIVTTASPLLGATVLLVLVRRLGERAWRVLAAVGLVLGVLTIAMPLTVTASTGTQVALGSMHVLTGLVWFVLVRRAARVGEQHPMGRS